MVKKTMASEKTTIGDRVSTGTVNAAVAGAATAGGIFSFNAINRLFSKTAKLSFSNNQWKVAAIGTAIGGLLGFVTANREKEAQREAYLNSAIDDANNPAHGYSQKQKEAIINNALEDVMTGKVDKGHPSTKYQDMINAQRAAVQSREAVR